MPRLPALRAEALADLEAQLRFAPRDALLRDIERAEALASDVEPEQAYPIEWVVFRITGYRPDRGSAAIRGEDLLADLSALVERLCAAARLSASSLEPGRFLTVEELAARWSVSRSTINRHRKRGLVARRVREASGLSRLAFSLGAVEGHEARHAESLARAGAYSRFDDALEVRMLSRARRYAARTDLSLNEAAARIAARFGRSHEGVRQLLRRGGSPFDEQGPPTERERRLIHRASRRAIEPREIAARVGRSIDAVRRALDDQRAAVLTGIDRSGALEGADAVELRAREASWTEEVLGAPGAREGLRDAAPTDVLALITWARERAGLDEGAVRARLLAYDALRARAAREIRTLRSATPSPRAMDRAETDIRWAALLKVRLGADVAPAAIREVEEALGAPADRLRPGRALEAIAAAMRAAAVVLDTHDPVGSASIAAPLALGVSGAVQRLAREADGAASGRATPRVAAGVALPAWIELFAPRFAVLLPDARLGLGLGALDAPARSALEERYGFGGPPSTLEEIGARRGVRAMHVARLVRRAERGAMGAARAGAG